MQVFQDRGTKQIVGRAVFTCEVCANVDYSTLFIERGANNCFSINILVII